MEKHGYVTAELNSELTTMPRWMTKVGLKVVLGVFIVVPSLALTLPWNESVLLTLEITSEQAPASISAPYSARVRSVLVRDGENLDKGDPIVILEDKLETGSMAHLTQYIQKVKRWLAGEGECPMPSPIATRASLQLRYTNLLGSSRELKLALSQDPDLERKRSLQHQIALLRSNSSDLSHRYALSREALVLAKDKLEMRGELLRKGWVTPNALIDDKSQVVRAEMAQAELAIISRENRKAIEELSGELSSLNEARELRHADLTAKVREDLASLEGELERELAQRIIRSPVAGRVLKITLPEPGMTIQQGGEIVVVSRDSYALIGHGKVGPAARSIVVPGQLVYLEFADFPAVKYGFVRGRVSQVAAAARDGKFEVQIKFRDRLRSERGFDIPFRERMVGTARVVTREGRVWERIFGRIRNLAT